MYALRIACPHWEEDGPWPSDFEHPCRHIRIEIGLPLKAEIVVNIVRTISICACGENLVILTTAPESTRDTD